ncbi:MAG: EamA family transporter [Lachnospiraceae bacterium]|nr:EamA family transporter [Lachnospiraceae bacterium]
MDDIEKARRKGFFLVLAGGILWGTSGACGQFLFEHKGMVATWLVPYRLLFSGVVLLTLQFARRGKKIFRVWKTTRDITEIIIFGLIGMAGCQFTYFFAIQYSNAGTGTVLQSLATVMITTVTCIMARRKPYFLEIIAVLCAFAGAFLLATKGNPGSLELSPKALISGVISAGCVVVYSMEPENLVKNHGTLTTVGWGMLIGGVVLFLVFRPFTMDVPVDLETVMYLAVIFIVGTVMAFSLYLEGIKYVGAKTASLLGTVEPVVAAMWAALALNTSFTAADIAGFVLILSTIFLCVADRKKEKE